jgi:hypothetical protein
MRPPVPVTGVTREYQSDSSSKRPHRRAARGPQGNGGARPPRALRHTVGRAARSAGGIDTAERTVTVK